MPWIFFLLFPPLSFFFPRTFVATRVRNDETNCWKKIVIVFFFFCIYLYNFSIQGNDVSLILDTDCCKKTKRVLRRFVVDVNEKTVERIVGNIYIILLSLFFIIYSTFSTKSRDWILSASQKEDDKITKSFNEKLQLILTSRARVCVCVRVCIYVYSKERGRDDAFDDGFLETKPGINQIKRCLDNYMDEAVGLYNTSVNSHSAAINRIMDRPLRDINRNEIMRKVLRAVIRGDCPIIMSSLVVSILIKLHRDIHSPTLAKFYLIFRVPFIPFARSF